MSSKLSVRRRALLSVLAVVGAGAALTAAALSDSADVLVNMDGSQNRFDIVAAGKFGSDAEDWGPTAADWVQGNPEPYEMTISPEGHVLAPGGHMNGVIAVKNASPRIAGQISLTILDPLPQGDAIDPHTGAKVELFDQLIFTVRDGERTLVDHVPANDLETYSWPAALPSGDHKVLDVTIEMSSEADNRWQLAKTDVQFRFEAVSR